MAITTDPSSVASTARPALVRVAIPHYYAPGTAASGYGSCRADAKAKRLVALSRCLGSVLALQRGVTEEILGIEQRQILAADQPKYPTKMLAGIQIDCHLFVQTESWLQEVVAAFGEQITVHQLSLEDPKRLPHAARDFLLQDAAEGEADLSLYLEDDLVIHDRFYIDKLLWFFGKTNHQFALMPHRFEMSGDPHHARLFVDGPIASSALPERQQPRTAVAHGVFWNGESVVFDIASNPHGGSFAISSDQRRHLLEHGVADEGFIGPLETVATLTVMQHLPVLKPSWAYRDFLSVEHAHPSFLYLRQRLPRLGFEGS